VGKSENCGKTGKKDLQAMTVEEVGQRVTRETEKNGDSAWLQKESTEPTRTLEEVYILASGGGLTFEEGREAGGFRDFRGGKGLKAIVPKDRDVPKSGVQGGGGKGFREYHFPRKREGGGGGK